MRKMLVIWLLIPFIGFSQQKNVINVTKVFAKPEKILNLKKRLPIMRKNITQAIGNGAYGPFNQGLMQEDT